MGNLSSGPETLLRRLRGDGPDEALPQGVLGGHGRGQDLATPGDVLAHLVDEGLDRVEPQGRPQVGDEVHRDTLAVEVEIRPVEDVGLNAALVPVEGRVGADGDGRREGAVSRSRLAAGYRVPASVSQPA